MLGPDALNDFAPERLAGGPFWIHLDVDVLDEREMPATDYLMPGGLNWDELTALMQRDCARCRRWPDSASAA